MPHEDTILGDGTPNRTKHSKASSGAGHGGKRSRPRSSAGYRSRPHRTSSATLLRKYAEEAVWTLVTTMRDRRASYTARVKAAKKLLNWTYGPPPNYHIELLRLPEEIPELPPAEEIAAEIYRRGLLRVLDLIDEEVKRDRRDDCEPMTEQEAWAAPYRCWSVKWSRCKMFELHTTSQSRSRYPTRSMRCGFRDRNNAQARQHAFVRPGNVNLEHSQIVVAMVQVAVRSPDARHAVENCRDIQRVDGIPTAAE